MPALQEGDRARYHLGTTPKSIEIVVNKAVVPTAEDFPSETTEYFRRELGLLHSFTLPSSDKEWGYGSVIRQFNASNPDYVIFQADLPIMDNGNSRTGYAIAATLGLIFSTLYQTDKKSTSNVPQFCHVNLTNQNPDRQIFNNNPMDVTLFQPFVDWIQSNNDVNVEKIVSESMIQAYSTIHPNEETEYWHDGTVFKKVSDSIMYFHVPGDATSLSYHQETITELIPDATGPLSNRFKRLVKHRLTPKNLDLVDSQLTLLVGVAKLEELATGGYFRQPTK